MDWKKAVTAGVISSEEAAQLQAANLARIEVVRVDDFEMDKNKKDKRSLLKAFSYH